MRSPRPDDNCDLSNNLCWEGTFITTRGPNKSNITTPIFDPRLIEVDG